MDEFVSKHFPINRILSYRPKERKQEYAADAERLPNNNER